MEIGIRSGHHLLDKIWCVKRESGGDKKAVLQPAQPGHLFFRADDEPGAVIHVQGDADALCCGMNGGRRVAAGGAVPGLIAVAIEAAESLQLVPDPWDVIFGDEDRLMPSSDTGGWLGSASPGPQAKSMPALMR